MASCGDKYRTLRSIKRRSEGRQLFPMSSNKNPRRVSRALLCLVPRDSISENACVQLRKRSRIRVKNNGDACEFDSTGSD